MVETVADLNSTIIKFREVVQRLTDENILLRRNLEEESSKSIPGLVEALDFKVQSISTSLVCILHFCSLTMYDFHDYYFSESICRNESTNYCN